MIRNQDIPKVIFDLPGFEINNLVADERWKAVSHFAHNAPGLTAVVEFYEMEQRGELDGVQGDYLALLINALVAVVQRALDGDEAAGVQLEAVHKMVFPQVFDLQRSHIKMVASLDRTKSGKGIAALSRAYDVRRWMSKLSLVIEPVDVTERLKPSSRIRLRDEALIRDMTGLWIEVKDNHVHSNMTLQSLAIRLYSSQLEHHDGTVKSYADLEKDLRAAPNHDAEYSPTDNTWQLLHVVGGDPLLARIVAGSWRKRKLPRAKGSR